MKVNRSGRRTGKTTKMLIEANKNGNAIVITPTFNRLRVLEHIAKEKGIKNIKVVPFQEFLDRAYEYRGYHLNIYIDDYDEIEDSIVKIYKTGLDVEIKEVNITIEE